MSFIFDIEPHESLTSRNAEAFPNMVNAQKQPLNFRSLLKDAIDKWALGFYSEDGFQINYEEEKGNDLDLDKGFHSIDNAQYLYNV